MLGARRCLQARGRVSPSLPERLQIARAQNKLALSLNFAFHWFGAVKGTMPVGIASGNVMLLCSVSHCALRALDASYIDAPTRTVPIPAIAAP